MGKYPSPEVARRNFETGVDLSKDKWATRAKAGATDYQLWFTGFANAIYPLISTLPDPTGLSVRERVVQRSAPVAEAIHNLSVTYKATKLSKLAEKARALVTVR
jgi:hypothetical protein